MTTPTNNPVPSKDPRDLVFNIESIDKLVNEDASIVNRKGVTILSISGAIDKLKTACDAAVSSVTTIKNNAVTNINALVQQSTAVINSLVASAKSQIAEKVITVGFKVPVPFAADIVASDFTTTVTNGGNNYFANPAATPFTTTATFNPAQWLLFNQEFAGSEIAQTPTYSTLRAYNGAAKTAYIKGRLNDKDGAAGTFTVDDADLTSQDNDGTVLVDALGRRWKRQADLGLFNVCWFGASPDLADISDALDRISLLVYDGSIVRFPTGHYKKSRAFIIEKPNVRVIGDGQNMSFLETTVADVDGVVFRPITAGITSAMLSGAYVKDIYVLNNRQSVECAGVLFNQCNAYTLSDVTINGAATPLHIKGGQLGTLKDYKLFATGGTLVAGRSALIRFSAAIYSGSIQSCYTVKSSNFLLTASKNRYACISIESGDGIQFSEGYVGFGNGALLTTGTLQNNTGIYSVSFVNTYFDGISYAQSPSKLIEISEDGFSGSSVDGVDFGSGCVFGNTPLAVLKTKINTGRISFNGVYFINIQEWAYKQEDGVITSSDLLMTGVTFKNVGSASSGVVSIANGRSYNLSGNTFSDVRNVCLSVSGSIRTGVVCGNSNNSNVSDRIDVATYETSPAISGNSSRYSGVNTWRGTNFANLPSSNPKTLDWYEEGTFTPVLRIGGASTGITYSSQVGTFTRIGNRVLYSVNISLTSKGSLTGDVNLFTLPYLAKAGQNYPSSIRLHNMSNNIGDGMVYSLVFGGGTNIGLYRVDVSGGTEVQIPLTQIDISDSALITISGQYEV